MKKLLLIACIFLTACGVVRKQDLDAWVGMPVEALDTHSLFLTVPMFKTITSSGIEVRNYANGADVAQCFNSGTSALSRNNRAVNTSTFTTCSSNRVVCNNLFYIRDGRVLEYAPTGQCFTDERVQPQKRYFDLRTPS